MFRHELAVAYCIFLIAVGATLWAFLGPLLEPKPYKNVRVVLSEVRDGEFNLVADFTTTKCKFQQLEIIGFNLAGSRILEWRDNDGLGQHHERIGGDHTLRITADTNGATFDRFEVRTRHWCGYELDENGVPRGGEMVDRIFMEYVT